MSDNQKSEEQAKASNEGTVQIVYMERTSDEDPESTHIQTLASVLGSEEAAKSAILYSYKHTVNGFSAKLTPEQVDALSKMPGVLQVMPSQKLHLHKGAGLSSLS
ncbi:hypothetical protein SUGI_0893590 [Cryptomeria japonica]|nr:hypothetical protein SUGI_0893590 [Cryptomeria japonica]